MVRSPQVKQLLIISDNVVKPGRFDTLNEDRQKSSDQITFLWVCPVGPICIVFSPVFSSKLSGLKTANIYLTLSVGHNSDFSLVGASVSGCLIRLQLIKIY